MDPLALDGADEPQVELAEGEGAPADGAAADLELDFPSSPSPEAEESPRLRGAGHPVRDRLLAKARLAEELRGVTGEADHGASDPLWRSPLDELERVAPRRAPSAPPTSGRRGALPANLTALFGTLFGLATFAAVFAVLIHVDPRDGAPVAVATSPAAAAASAPVAEADAPASPDAPPPIDARAKRVRQVGPWRIDDSKDGALRRVEGTVGREPFLRALGNAGVPQAQAYRLLTAFKGVRDFDKCGSKDQFIALIERASSRLKAFEYIVTKEEVYQAREGDDGLLKGTRLDLKVERARVQGALVITSSFADAAKAAGFEPGLSAIIDEALDGHASVEQFKKGDRLRVVAQEVTVLGEFARYAGLEALEYVPRGDAQPIRVYYFRGTKSRGYYDAAGRAPFEGGWRKPIKGAPITSKFNPKRLHPVLKKVMPHNGTDFGAPMGTPVGASSPGTISFIGYSGASGNLVLIEHAKGYETGYAHLSRFESGLKVGDKVERLQILGYVGSTGRSTGPHLHFSAKKDGKFIDAESLGLDSLRVLPKDERTEFSLTRAEYDKLLDAIALPAPIAADEEPAPAAAAPTEDDASEEAAAAAPVAARDPGEEEAAEGEMDDEPLPRPAEPRAVPAAAPVQKKEEPAPAPAPPRTSRSSLYLTDGELMKSQSNVDNGEVDE